MQDIGTNKRGASLPCFPDLGVLLTASTRSMRFIGFHSHSSRGDEAGGCVETNLLSFLAYMPRESWAEPALGFL